MKLKHLLLKNKILTPFGFVGSRTLTIKNFNMEYQPETQVVSIQLRTGTKPWPEQVLLPMAAVSCMVEETEEVLPVIAPAKVVQNMEFQYTVLDTVPVIYTEFYTVPCTLDSDLDEVPVGYWDELTEALIEFNLLCEDDEDLPEPL